MPTQTIADDGQAQVLLRDTQKDAKEYQQRRTKVETGIDKTAAELRDSERELVELQKEQQRVQVRREKIDLDLEQIDGKLRRVDEHRRQNRDEERLSQAVATLKRHFTGVHGRLLDLCRPTQRKFNLAVTVRVHLMKLIGELNGNRFDFWFTGSFGN